MNKKEKFDEYVYILYGHICELNIIMPTIIGQIQKITLHTYVCFILLIIIVFVFF